MAQAPQTAATLGPFDPALSDAGGLGRSAMLTQRIRIIKRLTMWQPWHPWSTLPSAGGVKPGFQMSAPCLLK